MKNEPLVSVVMPVYNNGEFLKKSMESIINQTYSNIELIVVDSSTDKGTISLFDKENPLIKYYWIEKNGIANALNYGISKSNGLFIARMDADDISYKERIEKQVEFLVNNPDIMVLGTKATIINRNGKVIGESEIITQQDEIKCALMFRNVFYHPTVMFRRKVFEDGYRYDANYYAEDYDLWTRLALKYRMSNLNDKLLFYRRYDESSSHLGFERVHQSDAESGKNYIQRLFNINLDNFPIENMIHDRKCVSKMVEQTAYAGQQAELLYSIYMANKIGKSVDSNALIYELNRRWKWVTDIWGDYEFVSCYANSVPLIFGCNQNDSWFFMEQLADKLNCSISDKNTIMEEIRKEVSEISGKFRQFVRDETIEYVIYGAGTRGKIFISELDYLNKNQIFNWKLKAVVDKRKSSYIVGQKEYETIHPNQITDIAFNYIIVTSEIYFDEIRSELISLGIPYSKILNGNALYLLKSQFEGTQDYDNY